MKNSLSLISLILFLIIGCKTRLPEKDKIIQIIDTLNMDIYSKEGSKIYSINSPESNYDQKNNIFNLKKTTINIFKDNSIIYTINSNNSKLSDNNRLLELNGSVELNTISQDNDKLYADNFIWQIKDSTYLLKGNVKFENNYVVLISNKATLKSNNIIEFFNPVKYSIKRNNNDNKGFEINSENAFYNLNTKTVSFSAKNERVKSKIYF